MSGYFTGESLSGSDPTGDINGIARNIAVGHRPIVQSQYAIQFRFGDHRAGQLNAPGVDRTDRPP